MSRRRFLAGIGFTAAATGVGVGVEQVLNGPSAQEPRPKAKTQSPAPRGYGRLQEVGEAVEPSGPSLAEGVYRTRPADALLDLAGVVAHSGGPSLTGDAVDGLHGINPYSYPEALVPLIAEAGIRWVRLDVQPGNGQGSLGGIVWSGSAVTPMATANDEALYGIYAHHGIDAMVGVSDSRSMGQLTAYAAPGGVFERLGWWPRIIESMNENYNFLSYPMGNYRGPWEVGRPYAVGDVTSGRRQGGNWYCIQAHVASVTNETPDTSSGGGAFMDEPDDHWVPQWAFQQLTLNQQTTSLRDRTRGLADTLIADGGNTNDSFVPTLAYASLSLGLGGSLVADLFNVHDYANPAFGAVDNEIALPSLHPLGADATTTGLIVLGETGVTCATADYASGNNMLLAWFEAYRLGRYDKVFGYHIMDDTGSYPPVVPSGVIDYGLLAPTPGTKMPYRGAPGSFPITPKPGYELIKNMFRVLSDPGPQPRQQVIGFHFTGNTPPATQPMLRRDGRIDIPIYLQPGYGTVNSPPQSDVACTIDLDTFTASRFDLYDPLLDRWTSSADAPGQTTWALEPGLNRYPRLLRVTPG